MRQEVSYPQATETDNHLIGYLAMAEMISESRMCEYCQTTLSKHLIHEDMAIRRPTHSGGFYNPNRSPDEHWTTTTSITTFLEPHIVSAPPRNHLPVISNVHTSQNALWAAQNLVSFRRRWLADPAWRQRRLRGWLSRLCQPSTLQPAPVEGLPAAHNVWELKLWSACAGKYDMVDLLQGRDLGEWLRMSRMHLIACESVDLRGRCQCRDVDGHLFQDPSRLAWYQGSGDKSVEAWRAHEARTLQAFMHPLLAEVINLQSGRRRLLATRTAVESEDVAMEDAPEMHQGPGITVPLSSHRGVVQDPRHGGLLRGADYLAGGMTQDPVERVLVPATERLAVNRMSRAQVPTSGNPLTPGPEKPSTGVEFEQWLTELWTDPGTQAQLALLKPKAREALRELETKLDTRDEELSKHWATTSEDEAEE